MNSFLTIIKYDIALFFLFSNYYARKYNPRGVEYDHRFSACRTKRLTGCPNGSVLQRGTMPTLMYPRPGCRPKTLPPFSNLSCPIPYQTLLHMVQHVADWVAPIPRSHHSPLSTLKFLHIVQLQGGRTRKKFL